MVERSNKMITYSPFFKPVFWIIMGLLYALIIAGAPLWAWDLGLNMTWWKWILSALWYGFLSFTFAGGFTLLGEKEQGACYKFIRFHMIIVIVIGTVLGFLIEAV
jgi:hypothetical protein